MAEDQSAMVDDFVASSIGYSDKVPDEFGAAVEEEHKLDQPVADSGQGTQQKEANTKPAESTPQATGATSLERRLFWKQGEDGNSGFDAEKFMSFANTIAACNTNQQTTTTSAADSASLRNTSAQQYAPKQPQQQPQEQTQQAEPWREKLRKKIEFEKNLRNNMMYAANEIFGKIRIDDFPIEQQIALRQSMNDVQSSINEHIAQLIRENEEEERWREEQERQKKFDEERELWERKPLADRNLRELFVSWGGVDNFEQALSQPGAVSAIRGFYSLMNNGELPQPGKKFDDWWVNVAANNDTINAINLVAKAALIVKCFPAIQDIIRSNAVAQESQNARKPALSRTTRRNTDTVQSARPTWDDADIIKGL